MAKNKTKPRRNAKSTIEVSIGKKGNRKFSVSRQISQEAYNLKKLRQEHRNLRQQSKNIKQEQKTKRIETMYQDNKYIGMGKGFGYASTPIATNVGSASAVKSGSNAYINRNNGAVSIRKGYYEKNPDDEILDMSGVPGEEEDTSSSVPGRDMSRR